MKYDNLNPYLLPDLYWLGKNLSVIMKKLSFILMLIVCANTISAQKLFLKQYYYWINQAELAVCDNSYQKASDCYDKAFRYKDPFLEHASCAFTINYKYANQIDRAVECFHYLAQMGDKPEWYIEGQDTIRYFEVWNKIKIIADTTKNTVISELQDALYEIRSSDQYVRRHSELYDSDEAWYNAISETDSVNFEKITRLYRTYPVINDYTAGMPLALKELYIHFRRETLYDPKNILYKEVMKGNVNAAQYARLEDQCMYDIIINKNDKNKTRYGTTSNYFFCLDTLGFILEPENLKKINKERKRILLSETWEDYAKKVAYQYQNDGDFHFVPLVFTSHALEEREIKIKNAISGIENGTVKGSYYVIPESLR